MKRKTLNPVGSPERIIGKAEALAMDAGNRVRGDRDETLAPSPGSQTASSNTWWQGINQAGHDVLGLSAERVEYVRTTVKRRLTKDGWPGIEAGIAEKSGNADGVKASTVINRERTNINYTQR